MGFDTQTMRVGPYRANGREIKGDRARFAQCSFKTTSSQFRRAWDPQAATMLGTLASGTASPSCGLSAVGLNEGRAVSRRLFDRSLGSQAVMRAVKATADASQRTLKGLPPATG